MAEWMIQLGICVSIGLMAVACFQSERVWARRLGVWLLLTSLLCGVWFMTSNVWAVALGAFLWFSVPVGQAVYLSRKLRFPTERALTATDFAVDEFPDLPAVTREIRSLGFQQLGDFWLEGAPVRQGYRLFFHEERAIYASAAIVSSGGISLLYFIFMTPDREGNAWITWDYPLTYGLKTPPSLKIYRCLEADSIEELMEQHLAYLAVNKVSSDPDQPLTEELAVREFTELFAKTLDYNVRVGVLQDRKSSDLSIRYSWRGTAYLSWQVLRDMVVG